MAEKPKDSIKCVMCGKPRDPFWRVSTTSSATVCGGCGQSSLKLKARLVEPATGSLGEEGNDA